MNDSDDTFKLHKLILRCLKNIREFFQVDRMSDCEIEDHQKVSNVSLTQRVLRDRKNVCVLRGLIRMSYYWKTNFFFFLYIFCKFRQP